MEITKITADLRLTFPIRYTDRPVSRADGESDEAWAKRKGQTETVPLIWAYHVPISRETFEANWRIISATAGVLTDRNVGPNVVSVATLALKDAGRQDAIEYGLPDGLSLQDGGTAAPLLQELKRLTLVFAPGPGGYEMMPVDVAISNRAIDAEDWREAESALVFFTCGYSLATRQRRAISSSSLASILSGLITSSDPTAFGSSLNASTSAKVFVPEPLATQSLVPS